MGQEPRLEMLETIYKNKKSLLKKSQDFFQNSNLIPKIGIELEFFLFEIGSCKPASIDLVNDFILELQQNFCQKFPLIIAIEKEQGASQVEIKTSFTADLARLCEEIESAKIFIPELAVVKNLRSSFVAKPLDDDCGNALQLNISLHNADNKNIFEHDESGDESLHRVAERLLTHTNSMMIFFSPCEDDYRRFLPDLNAQLFKQGKNVAPVNLSFGHDNRSCAIRVPSIKAPFICPEKNHDYKFDYQKRLEYRIPAASADPWLTIAVTLLAMSVEDKDFCAQKFAQIYGNAFDSQYCLEGLCGSLQEAENNFFRTKNPVRHLIESFNS